MKYCLLGRKLPYSFSSVIHKISGLEYELKEVEPYKLKDFVLSGEYDGFNVTIPYKTDVMPYLDEVSEKARAIGSVNTVLLKDGKRCGYNTDYYGLKYLFDRAGVSIKNKNVLILGSGGTYKTAAHLCKNEGAKSVNYVSRTGEINYANCYEKAKDAEIIINCTPVGTYPDIYSCPVDLSRFNKIEFVADCVYNPIKTKLTVSAQKLGIKNSNGLPMLVYQALLSEEIWTGEKKTDLAQEILKELIREKSNIVLYGMPSSGKTTIGKFVADLLNREFIDTDEEIFKKTGRTPSDIINTDGEYFFRNIETEVVKEISSKSGVVIATGGGAVLREENVDALKLNGVLIYLKRDLRLLSKSGRPLTEKFGAEKLYEERKGVYEKIKDIEVKNDKSVKSIAEEIIKGYENISNKRS